MRSAVVDFLHERGQANTSEIFEHLNNRFCWGATMNQLGNVLARDPRFMKSGFDDGHVPGGFRMRVCIWSLAEKTAY